MGKEGIRREVKIGDRYIRRRKETWVGRDMKEC